MKSKTALIAALVIIVIAVVVAITNSNQSEKLGSEINSQSLNYKTGHSEKDSDNRPTRRSSSSTSASKLEWEKKIDLVLSDDAISTKKATDELLGIVLDKKAPVSVRNDALEHALNLIDDQDFDQIQSTMETGSIELPEPLVQTILDDTLNRENGIQVTTALIAIQGSHSTIQEEARELLEFHLEQEHGDNLQLWQKAVNDYIAEQKKEETTK